MNKKYTLITGASGGLGSAFAHCCARLNRNLILIALPGSAIKKMGEELSRFYQVDIKVFEFDLTDRPSFDAHVEMISRNFSIDFLINNAGMGGTVSMLDCAPKVIDKIIQLNIGCTALLTRQLLPLLLEHDRSFVLNIASMAAFSPIAYKTVYPASKAFVSSFSLGLREEMQDRGVSVSVAYPGPIMTNSNTSQRILLQGYKGRLGLFSTMDLANRILRQTLAGRATIVPGWWNRMNQKLMGLIPPTIKVRLISGAIKRELQLTH
ncbi:SDR family NAD(P)-dependent oxidoreductase [Niabella beijingensis]|uniref:SDR family NAD(P)-dependent oxidoreductase n=1 Tax=Niabella beijingensis TaxID=2872700 RepID=UPI001CBFB7DA|nr:SDR family NAD(P)-dependent oxidoreductase [Niabella beijingensis]MBZ4192379.1 SDR family NAD(P)-dependent oxidoreductase [Niabella beijingensis]